VSSRTTSTRGASARGSTRAACLGVFGGLALSLGGVFLLPPLDAAPPRPEPFPADAVPPVVERRLRCAGSDAMWDAMADWTDAFRETHPGVLADMDLRGSSGALPALAEGKADVGALFRAPKETELAAYRARRGQEPLILTVGWDAVVIYVPADNPVEGLTAAQLRSVFLEPEASVDPVPATWGDLGASGRLAGGPIERFGRSAASFTHTRMRIVLTAGKRRFRRDVDDCPGGATVAIRVADTTGGIGYAGWGFSGPVDHAGVVCRPTLEVIRAGRYPLAAPLRLCVARPFSKTAGEFLAFVLSPRGREIAWRAGLVPLTADAAREELRKVE
jgi:phosphate transport system substrate-binding protein